MTEDEVRKRMAEVMEQELRNKAGWWWCSFANDGGFLGVAIVRAQGIGTAIMEARRIGINPGGEVLSFEVAEPPEIFKNVLLDREMALQARIIVQPVNQESTP